MIKEAINQVVLGQSLTREQAAEVMEEMTGGHVTPAQFAAFVTALRIKGETADEIAGLAGVMRAKSVRVKTPGPAIDIVGTGGDGANTFNVSTAAAFVAAGAGITVAKHNNRAMSSRCGSADVLEALGVKIDLDARQVEACLERAGIGFMFAPGFHPATKFAGPPRKEIGIRTVFNILGPLTNPALTVNQLIGAPSETLGEKLAQVLLRLGASHALVVFGMDGLDEVSISGQTRVWELNNGGITSFYVTPEDFRLSRSQQEAVKGGTPAENAAILRGVLAGESGPRRDMVLLNAAAGVVVANRTAHPNGLAALKEGLDISRKSLDSGRALAKLELLIEVSRSLE
jgi:anthranilate phosphoribosyltransferase